MGNALWYVVMLITSDSKFTRLCQLKSAVKTLFPLVAVKRDLGAQPHLMQWWMVAWERQWSLDGSLLWVDWFLFPSHFLLVMMTLVPVETADGCPDRDRYSRRSPSPGHFHHHYRVLGQLVSESFHPILYQLVTYGSRHCAGRHSCFCKKVLEPKNSRLCHDDACRGVICIRT